MLIRAAIHTAFCEIEIGEQLNIVAFFRKLEKMPYRDGEVREIEPTSTQESRALLAYYCDAMSAGRRPPRELELFIAAAFATILRGNANDERLPAKAFVLKQRKARGRPTRNTERDSVIASEVRRLMDTGETLFQAALSLSEKYGIHESNVQKLYCKFKLAEENVCPL